jgi:hypothetical protein
MRNYLAGVSFDWISDECKESFFSSLENCRDFRFFWNKCREWRQSAGDAISLCLEALQSTGVDADNGELSAFWVESFEDKQNTLEDHFEEWMVTLSRREHSWTRFLKDTHDCLTMAAMSSSCLDLDGTAGWGRSCRQVVGKNEEPKIDITLTFPVLQTAVLINESLVSRLVKQGQLRLEKSDCEEPCSWDISGLKRGTKFSLGEQGTLTVYTISGCGSALVVKWDPVLSQTLHEFINVGIKGNTLGTHVEGHHREYIRGQWKCEPLRVLIVS